MYRYFFHYNKPLSKIKKKPQLSIHFRGSCYFVDKIVNNTKCESKNNKRQPFCVIQGFCENVEIKDGVGIIE